MDLGGNPTGAWWKSKYGTTSWDTLYSSINALGPGHRMKRDKYTRRKI
jgi:hypothetical protein